MVKTRVDLIGIGFVDDALRIQGVRDCDLLVSGLKGVSAAVTKLVSDSAALGPEHRVISACCPAAEFNPTCSTDGSYLFHLH